MPGEISVKDCQKAGEISVKVWILSHASASPSVSYAFLPIHYPFLYPLYPLLTKASKWHAGPPIVARYARIKPLNARFRYAPPHCGIKTLLRSQFDQPYGLTSLAKGIIHAKKKNVLQPQIGPRWFPRLYIQGKENPKTDGKVVPLWTGEKLTLTGWNLGKMPLGIF
jgi:hypothetical protein